MHRMTHLQKSYWCVLTIIIFSSSTKKAELMVCTHICSRVYILYNSWSLLASPTQHQASPSRLQLTSTAKLKTSAHTYSHSIRPHHHACSSGLLGFHNLQRVDQPVIGQHRHLHTRGTSCWYLNASVAGGQHRHLHTETLHVPHVPNIGRKHFLSKSE